MQVNASDTREQTSNRSRQVSGCSLLLLLACCGGGGSQTGSAELVVATVAATATAVVGTPVVFDAGASTGASTFAWDFGDGTRGTSSKLAHVFTKAGSFTVTLHAGGSGGAATATHRVTVSDNPQLTPSRTLALRVHVRTREGAPIDGATVSVEPDNVATSFGEAVISAPGGVAFAVNVSKSGFVPQVRRVTLADGIAEGDLTVTMRERDAAFVINASAGGEGSARDGALLRLPPGALIDASGAPVTGDVQVSLSSIPVTTEPETFPGKFEGLDETGDLGLLVSWGTTDVAIEKDGKRLNLAPGKSAIVDVPMYTPFHKDGTPVKIGDAIPAWTLDERTGQWVQEGLGVVVESTQSPSGFALRVQASHFSWFNCDAFPNGAFKAKTKCMTDTNLDGVKEDLTGTGYCNNAGTNANAARQGSPTYPAFYVEAQIPASGADLLIPGGLPMLFTATAFNGLWGASQVVQGAAGEEAEVILLLKPVDGSTLPGGGPTPPTGGTTPPTGGTTPPTGSTGASGVSGASGNSSPTCGNDVSDAGALPTGATLYTINPAGQTDRFTLQAEANTFYTVTINTSGSNLTSVLTAHLADCGAVLATTTQLSTAEARIQFLSSEAQTIHVDVAGTSAEAAGYSLRSSSVPAELASFPFYSVRSDLTDTMFVFPVEAGDIIRHQVGVGPTGNFTGRHMWEDGIDATYRNTTSSPQGSQFTVTKSGTIALHVWKTGGTGPVTISVARAEPASLGQLIASPDTNLRPAELKLWFVTAPSGTPIAFGTRKVAPSDVVSPAIGTFKFTQGVEVLSVANNDEAVSTSGAQLRAVAVDTSETLPLNTVTTKMLAQLGDYIAMRVPHAAGEWLKFYARSPAGLAMTARRVASPLAAASTVYDTGSVGGGGQLVMGTSRRFDSAGESWVTVANIGATGPVELLMWSGSTGSTVTADAPVASTVPAASTISNAGFAVHGLSLPSGLYVLSTLPENGIAFYSGSFAQTGAETPTNALPRTYGPASTLVRVDARQVAPTPYTIYATSIEQPVTLAGTMSATLDPLELDFYRVSNGPTAATGVVTVSSAVGFVPLLCVGNASTNLTSPGCFPSALNQVKWSMTPNTDYVVHVKHNAAAANSGTYDINFSTQ